MAEFNIHTHFGFLPGCSLSSYNPEAVGKTVAYLNQVLPNFSAILKCCGKPTKDMGAYPLFRERFEGLLKDIADVGVEAMILACPNCKATFQAESGIPTYSLWEILPLIGLPQEVRGKAAHSDIVFTIHDSCATRYDRKLQDGIRWILSGLGYRYIESEASFENTKCCGFGGQVNTVNPEMTRRVLNRRLETLEDLPVVTYCSTCRSAMMQGNRPAWYILDLIWGDVVMAADLPTEDLLEDPRNVWHNRYETRKQIEKIKGV